jgi:hypothetical protein
MFFCSRNKVVDNWNHVIYEPELYDVVLLYIGSSTCGFCQDSELQDFIRDIHLNLVEISTEIDSVSYFTIGISKDYNVNNGYKHLLEIGIFNEIMVGNSWYNTALSRYIFSDFPAMAATPQVVLLIRKKYPISTSILNEDYRGIEDEQVLRRFYGKPEIKLLADTDNSEIKNLIQSSIK